MKQGKRTPSLPTILFCSAAAACLYGFSNPMRSDSAANKEAPLLARAPAPQSNPTAPFGIGVVAVGVATLAAPRRK